MAKKNKRKNRYYPFNKDETVGRIGGIIVLTHKVAGKYRAVQLNGHLHDTLPNDIREAALMWANAGYSDLTLTEYLNRMFSGTAHLYKAYHVESKKTT